MSSKQNRQLAQAAALLVLAFVVSRALGLAREIAIGYQFGTRHELDAYLAAFRLPDLIFQLVAGGALGSAFIPTFTGYLTRNDSREAWRLASAVFNLLLLILASAAAVAAIFAPQLVAHVIAPGFDPQTRALTVSLMRLMLLSPILFGLSGLFMGILNSYQHFWLPALAPIVYNLAIIAGAIFLAPIIDIYGLAVGVVIGALLHLLIQVPGLARYGLRYTPMLGLDHPGVREVVRLMLPRVLGLAAVQINFLVNTILASGLVAGSLAALNYAWLLTMMPQGIFAMAIATAVFPTLSSLVAREEVAELRRTFSTALRATLFLTIPAAVGLVVLREPLIVLLFQRGQFTEASTTATAWALQFYAIGLFAHATLEIVARAFYALHDTKTPVAVGIGAMGLNVVLSLAFIGPLAHGGLALANTIATIIEAVILIAILRQRIGGIEGTQLSRSVARIVAASALMAVIVAWYVSAAAQAGIVVLAGGSIAVGAIAYLAASMLLGSEEVAVVRRLLHR
jgi:putative peptidoglycan lipid II flippase